MHTYMHATGMQGNYYHVPSMRSKFGTTMLHIVKNSRHSSWPCKDTGGLLLQSKKGGEEGHGSGRRDRRSQVCNCQLSAATHSHDLIKRDSSR
jgi:hypothetical protein